MKSLCIIAIGTLLAIGQGYGQTWKDKIGLTKTRGKVKGSDLNEEETWALMRPGLVPDDGIINDFHKANINQVVFMNKRMEPKDITQSDVKTSFGINESIYFTFFMPKSFRNQLLYPLDNNGSINKGYYYDNSFKKWYEGESTGTPKINNYGSHKVKVFIDGELIDDIVFQVEVPFKSTQTAYTGYISPVTSEKQPSLKWINHMQKLSEGNHKIRVEVIAYDQGSSPKYSTEENVAVGEFTLTKSSGEKFAPELGVTFSDYKAGMTDANLEKDLLQKVQYFGSSNGYKEKFSAVKIRSSKWNIVHHKVTGAVLEKNIVAYCKSTFENGMCYVQEYIFRAQYNGAGYEDVYCSGIYNFSHPRAIDCK